MTLNQLQKSHPFALLAMTILFFPMVSFSQTSTFTPTPTPSPTVMPAPCCADGNSTVSTFGGTGAYGYGGDGGPATLATLNGVGGIWAGTGGKVYIWDISNYRSRERLVRDKGR